MKTEDSDSNMGVFGFFIWGIIFISSANQLFPFGVFIAETILKIAWTFKKSPNLTSYEIQST
jgi:hypothetical protein